MHDASTPSTLTSTLTFALACVRDLNAGALTEEQIALLHEIANFASVNAQEAAHIIGAEQAAIDRMEEDADDECAWISDALDHGAEDRGHATGRIRQREEVGQVQAADHREVLRDAGRRDDRQPLNDR